jgi:hypothetical protein
MKEKLKMKLSKAQKDVLEKIGNGWKLARNVSPRCLDRYSLKEISNPNINDILSINCRTVEKLLSLELIAEFKPHSFDRGSFWQSYPYKLTEKGTALSNIIQLKY